jgi:hypothetical protein
VTAKHYYFCLDKAEDLLGRSRESEARKEWQTLVLRIPDLVEVLRHIHNLTPGEYLVSDRWISFSRQLSEWNRTFATATNKQFDQYSPANWNKLLDEVAEAIAKERGTFYNTQGDSNVV